MTLSPSKVKTRSEVLAKMEEKLYQDCFGVSIAELSFELKYYNNLKKLSCDCVVCNHKLSIHHYGSRDPCALPESQNPRYIMLPTIRQGRKSLQFHAQGFCKARRFMTSHLFLKDEERLPEELRNEPEYQELQDLKKLRKMMHRKVALSFPRAYFSFSIDLIFLKFV